jgi:predicted glycosyltransferase
MRILIDVGHPSDVHLFRNFCFEMTKKNHKILFTARNKEVTFKLLDAFMLNYIPYGRPYKSSIGKLFGLIKFDYQLFRIARKFKPDLFLCHGSFYASHIAFLLHKPFITFEDTGNMEQILLYKPFTDVILTPESFLRNLGNNQIRFKGSKELAYLHPNQFKPKTEILNKIGVKINEKFVLLRFVGWNATHDLGHTGISNQNKRNAISELSKYAKVFISSETELPVEFRKHQINIPPEEILNVMYFSSLLYGESATMSSECAMMGTPAIFVNNANISYTKEQEFRYDLVYNYSESQLDQQKSIQKAIALIQLPDLKKVWYTKWQRMISDQIDLTAFMVWFVENYPHSFKIMKGNPEYQFTFK